jgi:hypothetical protein
VQIQIFKRGEWFRETKGYLIPKNGHVGIPSFAPFLSLKSRRIDNVSIATDGISYICDEDFFLPLTTA